MLAVTSSTSSGPRRASLAANEAFTASRALAQMVFAASFGMYKPGPVAAGYLAALEGRPAMLRAKAIEQAAIEAARTSP